LLLLCAKAKGPKHGKEDPTNAPHVGGNTWAGGTGGSDTAGLGGKGGPYRLDKGHQIYQINDAEKLNVPEEVKQAARQMAKEALAARLKEIEMKAYDAEVYEQYSGAVVKQVDQLRVVLEGLQAVNKDDRKWIKNQTDGDLDENRLVEGIIGTFVVDICRLSQSHYRLLMTLVIYLSFQEKRRCSSDALSVRMISPPMTLKRQRI
jgi:hypothetical protein